jgi:hypothetical protein
VANPDELGETGQERIRLLEEERQTTQAAHQALQNPAIVAYFDRVEKKAIDALLACDALDDRKRLKLTIVAQTVRELKSYLGKQADMAAYIEGELAELTAPSGDDDDGQAG